MSKKAKVIAIQFDNDEAIHIENVVIDLCDTIVDVDHQQELAASHEFARHGELFLFPIVDFDIWKLLDFYLRRFDHNKSISVGKFCLHSHDLLG